MDKGEIMMDKKNRTSNENGSNIKIYIKRDDAYRARVSDMLYQDGFFSRVYIRANRLVNEITNMMDRYEEDDNKDMRSMGNNIILFTADRGQGKTSAMNTFAAFLAEKSIANGLFEEENSCINEKEYEVLGIIDPTMMNQSESVVRVFLSRMFIRFEDIVRIEEEDGRSTKGRLSKTEREKDRIELLEQFSKCYENVNFLESKNKNYLEYNDLDSLARLGSSTELRKNIKELVRMYLEYKGMQEPVIEQSVNGQIKQSVSTTKRYLVLGIDDADLSAGNIFDICEQIREYLRIPRVIVLIAADFSQFRNAIFQEYLSQYKNLIQLQKRIEIVDTCYLKTRRYLEKMFPEGHRIFLPKIKDLIRERPMSVKICYQGSDRQNIHFDETHCSDIQEQLIRIIYERTGIVLLKNEDEMRFFFPATMRQLTQFLMELEEMEIVDQKQLFKDMLQIDSDLATKNRVDKNINTLQLNIERLYNYFSHEWSHSRINKKVFEILNMIMERGGDSDKARKKVKKYLQKYELEGYEKYYNAKSRSGALQQFINECKVLEEEKEEDFRGLVDAVSLYYSIKMNEWFLNLVRYGKDKGVLRPSDFLLPKNTSEWEEEVSYYRYILNYEGKSEEWIEEGEESEQQTKWQDIFLSERYSRFDVWNPIVNLLKMIPYKERLRNMLTTICAYESGKTCEEWEILLGMSIIVTNMDVLVSSCESEEVYFEENIDLSSRLAKWYEILDSWHKEKEYFSDIPDSFQSFGKLLGTTNPLLSYVFLSNNKNYKWYCTEYAKRIENNCNYLVLDIQRLQTDIKRMVPIKDGYLLNANLYDDLKILGLTISSQLDEREELRILEEKKQEVLRCYEDLRSLLNDYSAEAVIPDDAEDASGVMESSLEELENRVNDVLDSLTDLRERLENMK